MSSSYLLPERLYDARYPSANGDVLVEVKHTSNVRDLRDALLALAYALAEDTGARYALCVLTRTRLSGQRLSEELVRFRGAARTDLGQRIFLAAASDDGRFVGELPPGVAELEPLLGEVIGSETRAGRVSRQVVKAYLVECWLSGAGPLSTAKIRQDTGASYPTAVAAIEDLDHLGVLSERKAGGTMLREPGWDAWRRLAEAQSADRRILRFVDPSGLARSPAQAASRLRTLVEKASIQQVRLGGVLGAQLYDPQLDITNAPRLDLHASGNDIRFMRKLDAALVPAEDEKARADVVLHIGRQPSPEVARWRPDALAASPLDCLADLLALGYQSEARDLARSLALRAKVSS
ncbi:hypothetical protein [Aquabacterium humicola]|uniref:hypothetical protein n=1 Tax=Aquabacterium humicola TaxID=3237377 RepID=UPI002542920E|nr:hypothetical protein [Rubrivivax pictus]